MRIVLLEHPRVPSALHFNDIANTPLWSCVMTGYVASSLLEAGFDVEIIEATGRSFAETTRMLIDTPSELLAVHAVYFWEGTGELFKMLSELKMKGYGGKICLFGFFPTLAWEDLLNHLPEVDCIVVGEPEKTMVELARFLKNGIIPRCEGLAARVQGQARLFGLRAPIDPLDQLPFPMRPSLEKEETVSILASRGCYNGCSFCLIPTLNGGRPAWRGRTTANVAAEVAEVMKQGKKDFYFADPNFIGPGKTGRDQALDLSRALKELDITFGLETRANDLSGPLMQNFSRAGLSSLLLGIESGSPRVLKRLNKHTTVAQNERAIAAVRDAGIEPEIGFIMFEPASTLEDVVENLKFLERNRLLDRLDRTANLLYHYHIPFKGTLGYEQALKQKMLVPEGLFGFEGRLLYEDYRVGWLAGIMRSLCRFILKEMGQGTSNIYWNAETGKAKAFRPVNDQLVEIFKRILNTATGLESLPEADRTGKRLTKAREELAQALARSG